jgi:hypothetical protein
MDRPFSTQLTVSGLILFALGAASCSVEPAASPAAEPSAAPVVPSPKDRASDEPAAPSPFEIVAPTPEGACEDADGDLHGQGCAAGPDCDDANATVTGECTRCIRPEEGCECAAGAPSVPCGDTREGVCGTGVRVCDGGRWSSCLGFSVQPIIAATHAACDGFCDPTCRQIVDCPTDGDAMPANSTGVRFGAEAAAVFCPAGSAAGGITNACEVAPGGPYLRSISPRVWIDACAAAGSTRVLINSDEGVTVVPMPFTFSFYGVPYTSARVSANGYLSFSDAAPQWVNSMLPTSSVPNSVFAFWDDLIQRSTGVCVATVGAAPDRTFVAEWVDSSFFPANDPDTHLTFEVLLDERTSTVDVRYLQMTGEGDRATGGSATVGVQQGAGSSYDLVAYNTPGVTVAGNGFRWTPSATSTRCPRGEYRRVFDGACATPTEPTNVPIWGSLSYSATVPTGSSIHFDVRAADSVAELQTATVYRLPDAPRGATATSVPTSLNLGAWLRAVQPRLERARMVEVRAYLDPGAAFDSPPTLGSMEVQFNCVPSETPTVCRGGASCFVTNNCHQGQVQCDSEGRPRCVDMGQLPAGTNCGTGTFCTAAGTCDACDEGAACTLSNACLIGRVSCASGAPQCVAAANRPAGTVCGVNNNGNYRRDASPFGWFDACNAPGHTIVLAGAADAATTVALPFPFRFYGTARTDVMIAANGYMAFPAAPINWVNGALPETSFGDAILPFWDDLVMREGVCVATYGASPDRLFVAQWSNADLEDRGGTGNIGAQLNFEVVLEEASQSVSVIYGDMHGDARATGSGATVGIQSADNVRRDQVGFNTAGVVASGGSYRWSPPISGICDGAGTCSSCTTSEVCDGLDNNCNALIDDAVPDITCGVGACRRTVVGCLRGAVPVCTPGAPTTEICNTIDDDCDGMVDEGCNGSIACPADVSMNAGNTTALTLGTLGTVSNITWTVISGPSGGASSAIWNPAPPTSRNETFRPIIVGAYRIRVDARNGFNAPIGCEFNVTAQGHGIRFELTWDGTGDLDIHLHNSVNSAWYNSTVNDCHYSRMSTAWGAVLDVDNVTRNGPENIRLDTPTIGETYTVAVHHYANGAGRRATIKVYCGAGTTPVSTFVSAAMTGTQAGNCTNNSFWRVARVTANAMGSCTVTPINTVTTSTNACSNF